MAWTPVSGAAPTLNAPGWYAYLDIPVGFTASGQLIVNVVAEMFASLSLSGAGALAVTRSQKYSYTTPLGASGTLSTVIIPQYVQPVALSGNGTLTATCVISGGQLSMLLSGAGSLSAIVIPRYMVTIGLSGAGALTATSSQKYSLTPQLSGAGALSATALQRFAPAMALTGAGTLSATAAIVSAGPTFDAATTARAIAAGNPNFTHTVGAGGGYVLVAINEYSPSATFSGVVSSITCGGTPMTLLTSANITAERAGVGALLYGLAGVSAGAKTIAITFSTNTYGSVASVSYSGVTSVGSAQSNVGTAYATTFNQSITISGSNKIGFSLLGTGSDNAGTFSAAPTGGTSRAYLNQDSGIGAGIGINDATVTTTFSGTQSSDYWATLGVVIT